VENTNALPRTTLPTRSADLSSEKRKKRKKKGGKGKTPKGIAVRTRASCKVFEPFVGEFSKERSKKGVTLRGSGGQRGPCGSL